MKVVKVVSLAVSLAALSGVGALSAESAQLIDESFKIVGKGKPTKVGGVEFYNVVTAHSVFEKNGRTVVCAAYFGRLGHSGFKHHAKVKAGSRTIKGGLGSMPRLHNINTAEAKRLRAKFKAPLYRTYYPADLKVLKGVQVPCWATNKKWRPEFETSNTAIKFPNKIRVTDAENPTYQME